jgi:hypothetical protein
MNKYIGVRARLQAERIAEIDGIVVAILIKV